MGLKIVSQKEEKLLSRINVKAELTFEQATPSTQDVAKKIATAVKKDEKLVVVKKIDTHYGTRQADVDAVVYDSEKAKEKIEVIPQKKRKAAAEAAKPKEGAEAPKEEAPAAAKPAEAPVEEKKEEPTKEEAKPEEKSE